ncbi:MAG: NAD-dependent epimerase/dehydratase family protein [Planctomycetota bacterium]
MTSRRDLIRLGLLAGPAMMLDRTAAAADGLNNVEPASKKLDLLILGGTGFLGPHFVDYAIARGHNVTLFNRGRTNPHLFPDLEKIRGDRRAGDLSNLQAEVDNGRRWDAAIDTSCYYPRVVHEMMNVVDKCIKHYTVVSSISVYADPSQQGFDETAPVGRIENTDTEEITGETYGPLKALCEEAAEMRMPGKVANIRPGLIVGPMDQTDRFTYWPVRIRKGGEIMAPGNPSDPVTYIDVRDLAAWMVRCCENNTTGVFNANGPIEPIAVAELLYGCKAVSSGRARFTWVDTEFLTEHGVGAWMDMPVWLPPTSPASGFHSLKVDRAIEAGLTFRPLADTVRDTLAWWDTLPEDRTAELRAGIEPDREAEVLAAWHARTPASQPADAAGEGDG